MKWTWNRPWPSKRERKAAIWRAEQETAASRRKAQQARKVTRDLEEILARNHIAQAIINDLIAGHPREGR